MYQIHCRVDIPMRVHPKIREKTTLLEPFGKRWRSFRKENLDFNRMIFKIPSFVWQSGSVAND